MANDGKFNVALNEGHTPLAPDEPTFTFRGQDQLMGAVLLHYAELCDAAGSPEDHVEAIWRHREAVLEWQRLNGSRVPT